MSNVLLSRARIALVNKFVVSRLMGNHPKRIIPWLVMVLLLAVSWKLIRLVCYYSSFEEHDAENSIDFKDMLLTRTDAVINPRVIRVVDDYNKVADEVAELLRNANAGYWFPVLGMDVEKTLRPGCSSPLIHLLQFATKDGYCVLFRINHFRERSEDQLPPSLMDLLSNGNIWKVGVSVHQDAWDLRDNYNNTFEIGGTFDLRWLGKFFNMQRLSLNGLSSDILGATVNVHCHHGEWQDLDDLPLDKIFYAAMDAYLGILIFKYFFQRYVTENLKKPYVNEAEAAEINLTHFFENWACLRAKQFPGNQEEGARILAKMVKSGGQPC